MAILRPVDTREQGRTASFAIGKLGRSTLATSGGGVDHGGMWIDDRGSEVLTLGECRRLLAVAAKQSRLGHLGMAEDGAPVVLPVNFVTDGPDLVIRIGDALMAEVLEAGQVALQVDDAEAEQPWSVLVRGPAIEVPAGWHGADDLVPRVAEPGHRMVRIRADRVSGRRLGRVAETGPPHARRPLRAGSLGPR
jgi:hypothetical protein